jgi:hypothetical protein
MTPVVVVIVAIQQGLKAKEVGVAKESSKSKYFRLLPNR